ncbi:Trp family transcriptional regulator [Treponema sp.]|uniref:Trp family transcriptional regulator n=1 Tax=Treponema sp. TaxID=166 RepID=UPI0025EE2745|nr:Trp family transcriptional regulator [Treponema sp.]MCR5218248.1 trp operon repressor [Treponema sp.]
MAKETVNDTIKEICSLLADIQDENLIFDFFGCLFTKAELKDFSNRWNLVKELDAGTTQREIARKFGMSLCNITRGSREMKKEDSAFMKILAIYKNKNPSKE